MTKSLCIHLGDSKTGSTSIQEVLKKGLWSAEGVAAVYPVDDDQHHHGMVAATLYRPKQAVHRKARWSEIARRVRASDADLAIISAEWFEYCKAQDVMDALQEFLPEYVDDVRMIAYIRPHADKLVSSFQEMCKIGVPHKSLAAFHREKLRDGRLRYLPRLRGWREVFGERYTARPMLRSRLRDGDVVQDFLDFALQGRPFQVERFTVANSTLSLQDLALVREMHRRRRLPAQVGRHMAEALNANPLPDATPLRLDRALLAQVEKDYAEDAAGIDAEFFEGGPFAQALQDAWKKAVDAPQSLDAKDHFDETELRMIAVQSKFARMMALEAGWSAKGRAAKRRRKSERRAQEAAAMGADAARGAAAAEKEADAAEAEAGVAGIFRRIRAATVG